MDTLTGLLQERLDGIDRSNGEKAVAEQKHLDQGSDERVYWHYGYASALQDVLRLLQGAANGPVN
jgi:hypothetical protein